MWTRKGCVGWAAKHKEDLHLGSPKIPLESQKLRCRYENKTAQMQLLSRTFFSGICWSSSLSHGQWFGNIWHEKDGSAITFDFPWWNAFRHFHFHTLYSNICISEGLTRISRTKGFGVHVLLRPCCAYYIHEIAGAKSKETKQGDCFPILQCPNHVQICFARVGVRLSPSWLAPWLKGNMCFNQPDGFKTGQSYCSWRGFSVATISKTSTFEVPKFCDNFFSPWFRWVLPAGLAMGPRLPRQDTAALRSPRRPRVGRPAAHRGQGSGGCAW